MAPAIVDATRGGGGAAPPVMIVGSRLLQQGLAALLEQRGVKVVGSCQAGEAVVMAGDRVPSVVVFEYSGGERSTLSEAARLMKLAFAPRIVLVCRGLSEGEMTAAVDLGVDACISEDGGKEQFFEALDAVLRSECYIAPAIVDLLERRGRGGTGQGQHVAGVNLTPRQRAVLLLIAQGETEAQIAGRLGLSPRTVHTHRTSIMAKLGVHNRIALVRRAIQLGLADP